MSNDICVSEWTHPKLVAWEHEDKTATQPFQDQVAAYQVQLDQIKQLERAREKYRYEHETLPRGERRPHEDHLIDMAQAIREANYSLRAKWPYEHPEVSLGRALRERRAARQDQEKSVASIVKALKRFDQELLSLAEESKHVEVQLAELEEALGGLRAERDSIQSTIAEARGDWEQAANAAKFPGKPTIDLPLRASAEHRAPRLERSLIVGVNATERDVAKREVFERSIA